MREEMEEIQLKANKRKILGKKVKQLRRRGLIPTILYGHGIDPLPLEVEERALRRTLAQAGGSRLIALRVGRARKPRMILAREIQQDPITRALLHADFYEVRMEEKVTTEVPLVFVGESPIVERGEGILFHGLESVEIECLPGDLIQSIEVDLTGLEEIDQALHVRDLKVGPNIEIVTDLEELIVKVLPPEEEMVEEVVEVPEVEVVPKPRKVREEIEEAAEVEETEE